jgi:hypothetical protein
MQEQEIHEHFNADFLAAFTRWAKSQDSISYSSDALAEVLEKHTSVIGASTIPSLK